MPYLKRVPLHQAALEGVARPSPRQPLGLPEPSDSAVVLIGSTITAGFLLLHGLELHQRASQPGGDLAKDVSKHVVPEGAVALCCLPKLRLARLLQDVIATTTASSELRCCGNRCRWVAADITTAAASAPGSSCDVCVQSLCRRVK